MNQTGTRIIIMTKMPVPGKVKTRLIPLLGREAATALHTRLTQQTLQTALAARCGPVELWCHPSPHHDFFKQCLNRYPVTLHSQSGANLGERMARAAQAGLARSRDVIIIGTDCPLLSSGDLLAAQDRLRQGHEVCIKPAEDGGYVLIAMRRVIRSIFEDIPWSTREVLARTRHHLLMQSVSYAELAMTWDLDRPADYLRYRHLIDSGDEPRRMVSAGDAGATTTN